MKLFLSASGGNEQLFVKNRSKYLLESFVTIKPAQMQLLSQCDMYMIDSGAFTFRHNTKKEINWDEYVQRYATFIKQHNVKYFFQLDIDNIVGYQNVLKLREKLEKMTNKQPIPVWHTNRGIEEFKKSCEQYPYVALGGIAGVPKQSKIYRAYHDNFSSFISYAHSKKCKIHGLGYTSSDGMKVNHFDSVDSTTWLMGSRFGNISYYKNGTIRQKHHECKKCIDVKRLNEHNLIEWLKFQQYADSYL